MTCPLKTDPENEMCVSQEYEPAASSARRGRSGAESELEFRRSRDQSATPDHLQAESAVRHGRTGHDAKHRRAPSLHCRAFSCLYGIGSSGSLRLAMPMAGPGTGAAQRAALANTRCTSGW